MVWDRHFALEVVAIGVGGQADLALCDIESLEIVEG